MHPPSVYMMLTGEYDEEKTEDDVLQKLIEIAVGNLVEKEETPGQRIRYVDTPCLLYTSCLFRQESRFRYSGRVPKRMICLLCSLLD